MFVISENSLKGLQDFLQRNGIEPYRARQIFHWIYEKAVFEVSDFSNLPAEVIDFLNKNCTVLFGKVIQQAVSKSDKTTKFLIRLPDANLIESVLLYAANGRLTACLSTQVGCPVSCTFCASGKKKFKRNLSISEIVSQYLLMRKTALREKNDIANIVFMGIGEPLLNYDNLIGAIELLTDPKAAGMAARRLTISTAGVAPAIDWLANYKKDVNLSISLHSAFDKKRNLLVPLNKKYNIKTLIAAVNRFIAKTGRMVTFEYVLIEGLNDTKLDADQLSELLKGIKCKVNIIPYNPIEGANFTTPADKNTKNFTELLIRNKINTIERQRKGIDINSGCGQLKAQFGRIFRG